MKNLAMITARGGSKRIPRKNLRPFLGRPIIAYSIEAALGSGLFDEVMVSTDDEEIAEIARQHGAKVPFMRSAKNADDFSTTADVILEVLGEYRKLGHTPEFTCCIYPTAPFVTAERLREAFARFEASDAESLFPVTRFSFPIMRSFRMEEGGRIYFNWPEHALTRSQDLAPAFQDAGQFYFLRTEAIERTRLLVPEKTLGFELSELEVQDIDNEEDWALAEVKYRFLHGERPA